MYPLHVVMQQAGQAGAAADPSTKLGLAVQLAQRQFGGEHTAQQLERLFVALAGGQHEFYFDHCGRSVGFVAWVRVSAQVSRTLLLKGPAGLSAGHWQGGDQLWIMDMVAHDGCLAHMLADLRDRLLAACEVVTYFRIKPRLRIAKQLSRRDRTSFFQRPPAVPARPPLTTRQDLLHGVAARLGKARLLGDFLLALQHGDASRRSALWQSTYRMSEIIAARQYRLYGTPATGLLTWAWLSDYTIARMAEHPLHTLHSSEWNEGSVLCLCDAFASDSAREQVLADICSELFPQEKRILLYVPPTAAAAARLVEVERACNAGLLQQWLADPAALP